jgi:pimeloyl-ACP methyl ester carboxylesterase
MSTRVRLLSAALAVLLAVAGCQSAQPRLAPTPTPSPAPSPTPSPAEPWIEEEVSFNSGANALYGILTLPVRNGPHPAIVLISGSVNTETGLRDGVSSGLFVQHARRLVLDGFAILRYDPPGVGRSEGAAGFESLDSRATEAIAAVEYLRSRPDIRPDRVGLWGESQGGWVIAMAAAAAPQEVAFIISVSGAGVSVAEQQVYGVEAQTRAIVASEESVAKAVLFSRLLIDWQLTNPSYRRVNEAEAQRLGDGPWNDFLRLVYDPGSLTPAENLQKGIAILESIQDQPWARALYLKELYLPALKSITPDQLQAAKAATEQTLLTDPKDFLTRVRCPVLALFGEADENVPAKRSAELYEQYLTQAGNRDFEIVVFPGVGHSLGNLMPAYWARLSDWLKQRFE